MHGKIISSSTAFYCQNVFCAVAFRVLSTYAGMSAYFWPDIMFQQASNHKDCELCVCVKAVMSVYIFH